jgi:hypothetical protein
VLCGIDPAILVELRGDLLATRAGSPSCSTPTGPGARGAAHEPILRWSLD